MKFSETEIEHLLKAWVAISLAFAILLSKGDVVSSNFTLMLLVSGLTVGVGFIAHELGHKVVAQRYHCFAEFRASNFMLVIAVLMSFLGFIFAAPGAVIINGYVTKERNGRISLAGPLVNLVLALIFMGLYLFGIFVFAAKYGLIINSWLAVFNMIPILNFDGRKIIVWSKLAYYLTLAISVGLLIVAFSLK
ncbi:hypothetical protein J4438_03625 [Candidatus Woesearchaeota archaeon]|nr:hypothetical protein [Candidatus Woesearchaeota archaeon]